MSVEKMSAICTATLSGMPASSVAPNSVALMLPLARRCSVP